MSLEEPYVTAAWNNFVNNGIIAFPGNLFSRILPSIVVNQLKYPEKKVQINEAEEKNKVSSPTFILADPLG